MNKLTELIEAAKAATPGPWKQDTQDFYTRPWDAKVKSDTLDICTTYQTTAPKGAMYWEGVHPDATFIALANPATILELCALLEKAEEAMEAFTDPEGDMPADTGEFRDLAKALAAIKQWKEKT